MMKKALFNDDSNSEDDAKIEVTTNKDYAKTYNKFRQKELLQKLKDRNPNLYDESDSSSATESSEDEETTDPKFDEEFFKTLSFLKSKDPKIYSNDVDFFEETNKKADEDDDNNTEKQKKAKVLTVKDYERKVIIEKGGVYEDDDSDIEQHRPQSPTIVEEERRLKDDLKNALNNDDDEEDDNWGGIFKKRSQTREEKKDDDETYTKWLAGQSNTDIGEDGKVLKPLKEFWENPKITREEAFLRDYILNNGYQTKDDDEIPTYNEIVALSDDEQDLDTQEEFEHKFNFRFEDPDQEFIKRYPRTIVQSVRRTDDKRKEKRIETRERKLKEKEQRRQDLDVLKELKRQEIEEKIQKLKAVAGNEAIVFENHDLDEDFDPEAHDKKMQELFNDEYYEVDEGDDKPELPDDLDELKIENWDNYDPSKDDDDGNGVPHCEDPDFVMDCDYDPEEKQTLQDEMIENTKGRRKRKRKSKFIEALRKDKPAFDPEDEKTYAEYIDEYYKLDYEDMIGDLPCRFRYVETVPNDYGLTLEEILLAKNKELNQWASLKKAVQTRPAQVEHHEVALFKRKAQNEGLKKKIFKSLYGPDSEEEAEEKAEKEAAEAEAALNKKRKKRKRKVTNTDKVNEEKKVKVNETDGAKKEIKEKVVAQQEKPKESVSLIEKPLEKTAHEIVNSNVVNKTKKLNKSERPKLNSSQSQKSTTDKVTKTTETVTKTPSPNVNKTIKENGAHPTASSFLGKTKKVASPKTVKTFTKSFSGNKGHKNHFQSKTKQSNKKIKIGFSKDKSGVTDISENRLRAFGINPKKFQNHQKYGNKTQQKSNPQPKKNKQNTKDSNQKSQQQKKKKTKSD